MLNVDAGNSPTRPDNPQALNKVWGITWLAVAVLVFFMLAYMGLNQLRGSDERPASAPQGQEQRQPSRQPPP